MFNINDTVYIDLGCGEFQQALFKGYINEKLCYVKPKERFVKGGYGTTITCLNSKLKGDYHEIDGLNC